MRVKIERQACVSCGSCWNLCPNFFEEDPLDTFSRITERYRAGDNSAEGVPPENLESCARDAADLCPVSIITIGND